MDHYDHQEDGRATINLGSVQASKSGANPPPVVMSPSEWGQDQSVRTKESLLQTDAMLASQPGPAAYPGGMDESRYQDYTHSMSEHVYEGGDRTSREDKLAIAQL